MIPGERGFMETKKRLAKGIPIPKETYDYILELGFSLGINIENRIMNFSLR